MPFFEIGADDHDTESDLDREDLATRVVRRPRAVPDRPREEVQARVPTQLPFPKRPISATEQLAPSRVSRLQIREAVVKRMQPEKIEKPIPFRGVPEVRIAWVRSNDRGIRLTREGADGFAIGGISAENARVSVGVEGLIFTVATVPGESADAILMKVARRLELEYAVEILERTPTRSTARLRLTS